MTESRRYSSAATDALSMATEAMRNAAEAMSKVTDALVNDSGSTPTLIASGSGSRPLAAFDNMPPPQVPLRISSQSTPHHHESFLSKETEDIEKPPMARTKSGDSRSSHTKERLSHVDLMDAVLRLKDPRDEKTPRSIMQDYGEDVADRNMGGLYIASTPNTEGVLLEPAHPPGSTPSSPSESSDHPGPRMSPFREILFIVTVCLAQFLTQSALAQTIAPLPLITPTFYPGDTKSAPFTAWYTAAYALTVGTFILPSGRFGDVYGHKSLFVLGWAWFSLFSVLAGFSAMIQEEGKKGDIYLIVCRALQGIGPALLMPNGLALLGTTYPPGNKKNMIFAMFGAAAPAGFVIGATFSSLIAQKSQWNWGFWVLGMLCAGICFLSVLIIPKRPRPHIIHDSENEKHHVTNPSTTLISRFKSTYSTLDGTGALLGTTALILINISLNQAPLVAWSTPYTYFILIIGILLLCSFFVSQRLVSNPLIPLAALNPDTLFVLTTVALGWSSFGIWLFYIWSYMASPTLRNMTPLLSCAYFAPAPVSGFVASLATGFLLSRHLHPKYLMCIAMCAFFLGSTIMATTTAGPTQHIFWTGIFWAVLLMPWGMDMSFPSATILLSDRAGPHSQGVAASLVNTVVNYSISVGLGLAGTVERGVLIGKGESELMADRSAWFLGMGLSGTGIVVAGLYVGLGFLARKRNGTRDGNI